MFKRKLFKRALPFILSVAMMFESLPASALAAEQAETTVETETESVTETEESKAVNGETGEPDENSDETSGEADNQNSDSDQKSDDTDDQDADSKDESDKTDESSEGSSENPSEEPASTSETESSSTENVTETEEANSTETNASETSAEIEDVNEGQENKEVEADQKLVTKLVLADGVYEKLKEKGFEQAFGESDLTFATEYKSNISYGDLQDTLRENITINVDGEDTDKNATVNLSFKLTKDDKEVNTLDGAGDYKLQVILAAEPDTWSEASLDVYVKIHKAELTLDLGESKRIDPGKTVQDLKEQIQKSYTLEYADGTKIDDKNAVADIAIVVREAGSSTDLADTAVLNAKTGYEVKITVTPKNDNYTVTTPDFYKVEVGDLQKTKVELPDSITYPVVQTYGDTTATALKDLFAKKAKVLIVGENDEEDQELKNAEAAPGWYKREQVKGSTTDKDFDIAADGSIRYQKEPELKYVKLAEGETPTDAGEYYVIWVYAGDDKNAYEAAASTPVAATIEPAPVVVTIANSASELSALFHEGMESADVDKALTQIDYKVNTLTADGKVNTANNVNTEDFFGTTYAGDGVTETEQYYKPEFELQRAISKEKDKTIEDKDKEWLKYEEWSEDEEQIVLKDDDHEYVYRVAFTGNKGVYNTAGTMVGLVSADKVSDSVNRNYLVKVDEVTRGENAVEVKMNATKEAVIDTTQIVKAFNDTYKNATIGDGSVENPAVKIYDENSLFNTRSAYKKAQVKDGSNVISKGEFTYKWQQISLEKYKEYMDQTDEDKKNKPFGDYNKWPWTSIDNYRELSDPEYGNTEYDEGYFDSAKDANIYELTVSYKDSSCEYWAKEAKVYFKVEQQQIVIVPGEQVAQNGQKIGIQDSAPSDSWRYGAVIPGLDKTIYTAYKIPDNIKKKYDDTADKSSLVVSNIGTGEIKYIVQNKEKNPDGSNGTKYVDTAHDIFDATYQYGVIATYDGKNYTTKYVAEGVDENYTEISEIKFIGEGKLYVSIDKDKVQSLTKQYDGTPITLPAGIVTLYSDKEMTKDVTSTMLNTTSEYDPEKVNLYWYNGKGFYTTEDTVWGGEYKLALRFKGNEAYRPINEVENEDNGNTYGEIKVYDEYIFKITPRDITITPKLNSNAKAGETVNKIIAEGLNVENVVDKDKVFFGYAERANGTYGERFIVYKEGGYRVNDDSYNFDKSYGTIYKYGGYPAFASSNEAGTNAFAPEFIFQVNDKDTIKKDTDEYLKHDSKYTVKLTNKLVSPLNESYNVTYKTVSQTITNKGQSDVKQSDYNSKQDVKIGSVALKYEYVDNTYSIMPREAAPYYESFNKFTYEDKLIEEGNKEKNLIGNFIAYRVYAPLEFEGNKEGHDFDDNKSRFFYKESIAAAGGSLLEDWAPASETDDNLLEFSETRTRHYITVLFPVTENDKEKAFSIIWDEGYTETFKLTNVELAANLTMAVAPKSIKFNGVQSKMAVGDTQQLDVKITKRQLGDVIKLQYRIAGTNNETKNEFISIDPDTGVVTALHTDKKATTQIEVYPVYEENGKLVEITGQGVKTAKTKITVTNVKAPTVKKVVPQDETAKVQFTDAGNGYRREIYVIEAKKAKAADFESMIAGMQNNQWEKAGFAIAPVYSYATSATEDEYDAKTKLITKEIEGLVPGTNYVVYVRNVSQARTLEDGSVVDLSYNGNVKSFVAVKSQVQDLEPYFILNDDNIASKAAPVIRNLDLVDGNTDAEKIANWNKANGYKVDFSAKTAQLFVDGLFFEKYDGNAYAENKDKRRYALPLTKALQANYYNPKLTYGVFDTYYSNPWDADVEVEASKYATISSKGKITLKGTSLDGRKTVYVYVKADTDDTVIAYVKLTITAKANSVTGKKVKLKVGDDMKLWDMLEYKQDKNKIPNYKSSYLMISDEMIAAAAAAGYKIYDNFDYDVVDGDETIRPITGNPYCHDWHITAVRSNTTPFPLTVTDTTTDGDLLQATVTLTIKALDPVKSLKKAYVDDKNITINFKHAGNPFGYEIELLDARKNVVEKKFVTLEETVKSNAPDYEQQRMTWTVGGLTYFEKKDTFAYTIDSPKILRLSSYTVSVTPVYSTERGKTVTTKVKTTNIPAARDENVDTYESGKGGIDILYRYSTSKEDAPLYPISKGNPYFQSGNTYTLVAETDPDAKNRVTDTLTWKSSNTKVATIKANKGTYTATFKALRAGDTTISITSKITKKVIARFDVRVKAVGNADGFAGAYEPTWSDTFYKNILAQWDPFYDGRLEVLSVTDALTVNAASDFDRTWVSFTAPTYGEYTFNASGTTKFTDRVYYDGKNGNRYDLILRGDNTYSVTLEAGQKIYFRLNGSFTLEVVSSTDFARLTTANNAKNPLEVRAEGWIAFTAPEDNVYTFTSKSLTKNVKRNNQNIFDLSFKNDSFAIGLKAGETIFIGVNKGELYVEYRNAGANILSIESKDTVSAKLNKDTTVVYARFTALQTAKYTFETEVENGTLIEANIYEADKDTVLKTGDNLIATLDADVDNKKTESTDVYMNAGQTVIVEFKISDVDTAFAGDLSSKEYDVKVKVSTEKPESMTKLTLGVEETVAKNTTKTFKFEIPENGKYQFNIDDAASSKVFDSKYGDIEAPIVVEDDSTIKKGDILYIEVKAQEDKDAKVKVVSATKTTALTADKKVELKVKGADTTEYWYTFTATQEGIYEFAATPIDNKDKDGNLLDTHSATIKEYTKVFGTDGTVMSNNDRRPLMAGQTVIFAVTVNEQGKDVETTIEVSVTTVKEDATITVGPTTVSLEKANNEVIYKFTAVETDDYNIEWTKDKDEKATDAEITVSKSLTGSYDASTKKSLRAGEVIYIKAKATVDNAKGTLSITAAKSDIQKLENAKATSFEIKKDAKTKSKTYSYIAPIDSEYGIIVELAKDAGKVEDIKVEWKDYSIPSVAKQDDIAVEPNKEYTELGWFEKGHTIKVTLTSTSTDVDVKGTIKIQPTTPTQENAKELKDSEKVTVSAGNGALYQYKVPAYGRYTFTLTPDKDKNAKLSVKNANGDELSQISVLFNKGDLVYLTVSTDKVEDQTATLKVEAIDETKLPKLTADTASTITVANGAYAYYLFEAPEYATYNFATVEAVEGKESGTVYAVYKNDSAKAETDKNAVTLIKGDKAVVVLTAEQDNVQFKYTVKKAAINVLTEGVESKVTIKAGVTASFEFPVQNAGIYTFSIAGEAMTVDGLINTSRLAETEGNTLFNSTPENATYVVNSYDKTNAVEKFTVTNGKSEDATVTIKVTKVNPVELKVDEEKSIAIKKDECAIVSFIPATSDRYTFTTGNDLVSGGFTEAVMEHGDDTYKTMVLTVKPNEKNDNTSETAKVKVTTVKPVAITASPAAFKATGKEQTFWYEFKASKNAKYDFEVTNGKDNDDKVIYSSDIKEYAELRSEDNTAKSLSSKLMKKDDTVFIKVTVNEAKDADVKFNIKETAVSDFKEVTFKSSTLSGKTHTESFTVKKDELCTITVKKNRTTDYAAVKAVYKDKDGKEKELSIGSQEELQNVDADTKVEVTIEFNDSVKENDTFYIFVEKEPKDTATDNA